MAIPLLVENAEWCGVCPNRKCRRCAAGSMHRQMNAQTRARIGKQGMPAAELDWAMPAARATPARTPGNELGHIPDVDGYLRRMAGPLREKVSAVSPHIDAAATDILDVGCADGIVTRSLAGMFPRAKFLGVDLSDDFVALANESCGTQDNLSFRCSYLRDLLAEEQRYDVVLFCSVLHEFFSYGSGNTSVLKALTDAYELLKPGGVIIIRDMVLSENNKTSVLHVQELAEKLRQYCPDVVADFEACFGEINSLYAVNHLLLKYMYTDNWERECSENYVPVTFEQYQQFFDALGMRVEEVQSFRLPYLERLWRHDLQVTDKQMTGLRTTAILVARKGLK